jgi:hypothetical protein
MWNLLSQLLLGIIGIIAIGAFIFLIGVIIQ